MVKLNQLVALEKGIKERAFKKLSELYKIAQKPVLFNGMLKVYERKNEEDETFPSEQARVQYTVRKLLAEVAHNGSEAFDVIFRKETSNMEAEADIVVEGELVLARVPVTYLLFLEKQLTDLRTFVGSLPVLDMNEAWTLDSGSKLYRSEVVRTHKSRKVQKPIVLYPATPEHPAQTQLISEDVTVGFWATTKTSGAIPADQRELLLDRVSKLLNAVKVAREQANSIEETKTSVNAADAIFGFLWGPKSGIFADQ